MGDWTFFSNHGHVLVCLARNRQARLREVAQEVGITERAVQKIVSDLQAGGYLTVSKQGRCNRYHINRRKALRHQLQSQCTVGKLLTLLTGSSARLADADLNGDADADADGAAEAAPATPAGPPAPVAAEIPASRREAPPRVPPAPAAEPSAPAAAAPAPKAKPRAAKRDDEAADSGAAPDTRQQGSLF